MKSFAVPWRRNEILFFFHVLISFGEAERNKIKDNILIRLREKRWMYVSKFAELTALS